MAREKNFGSPDFTRRFDCIATARTSPGPTSRAAANVTTVTGRVSSTDPLPDERTKIFGEIERFSNGLTNRQDLLDGISTGLGRCLDPVELERVIRNLRAASVSR